MNGGDVRVVQCRGCLSLDFEARAFLFAGGYLVRQEFDGDLALEFGVVGFVDDTHAAFA